jgi:ribosome recycling factor
MSSQKYNIIPGLSISERYIKSISTLRSGRVNASILDSVKVEAYGSMLTFKEVATITTPEPHQLMITPFDKGLIKNIISAIQNSSLGVNPADDGAGVRLNFPPMTEEAKKERVKELHKIQEEARKDVRIHRQDILKQEKKRKEDGEISEDDLKAFEKRLQDEVDLVNKEIEEITKNKEAEIMKV